MNHLEEIKDPPDTFAAFEAIHKCPYPFFLDSACGHEKLGRFSFMGCDPFLVFKSKGSSVSLEWKRGISKIEHFKSDPFRALEGLLKRFRIRTGLPGLPFTSGAVGYFSYDLKDLLERLPNAARDDIGIPDCILGFYDAVAACDHSNGRFYITGSAPSRLKELRRLIGLSYGERDTGPALAATRLRSNFTKAAYVGAVKRAKEYIRKGDIYQVNISQRFETILEISPIELYRRLRSLSPAPFAAYLGFDDVAILSSSPERFIFKKGSFIETRPIKGTRPRGVDAPGDMAMQKELASSDKDMAEHIMIVDLERNDLGRICEFGSVRPTESAIMEKYANVFHLVSTVTGKLKKGVSAVDCLRATFPGGSITGAPKIRSMEIIDELEGVRRSAYTGALGYIGFDDSMDTSIIIRTFIIKGKKLYFQVGGGIVADSDPEREYEETLHKARGLMKALGSGVNMTEAATV